VTTPSSRWPAATSSAISALPASRRLECRDGLGKNERNGGRAAADAHGSALQPLLAGDHLAQLFVAGDDHLRLGLDQASHFGQGRAFAAPYQQFDAEMLLQLLQPARQRGLRHADALGGHGDRTGLGDGQKRTKQHQVHICKFSMLFMQSIHYTYEYAFAMLRGTRRKCLPAAI
jgi:hypothetical protein